MPGWIRLDRSIQDNWLWKEDEPFDKRSAWIDLLMLANFEDKKIPYKGAVITCKRGDVNLSISALAKRWHWSRDKVRNYLRILESDGMVTTKTTTHRTTVTLVNYGFFQDSVTTNKATNKAISRQQADTTNNNNNINNKTNISAFPKSSKFGDFANKQGYDMNKIEGMLLNDN